MLLRCRHAADAADSMLPRRCRRCRRVLLLCLIDAILAAAIFAMRRFRCRYATDTLPPWPLMLRAAFILSPPLLRHAAALLFLLMPDIAD